MFTKLEGPYDSNKLLFAVIGKTEHFDAQRPQPQDQITSDEKAPSWLPGKGKCGLSGEHASTANNVIGGVATAPGMFPLRHSWVTQIQRGDGVNNYKSTMMATHLNKNVKEL